MQEECQRQKRYHEALVLMFLYNFTYLATRFFSPEACEVVNSMRFRFPFTEFELPPSH